MAQEKLKNGNTALHVACRKGNVEIVEALVKRKDVGEWLHIPNDRGKTPGDVARNSEVVQVLLRAVSNSIKRIYVEI